MKRLAIVTVILMLILSACTSKAAGSQSLFKYDASVPFDTQVASQFEQNGVTVVDLSYATHDPAFSPMTGGRTLAYLVTPHGKGPFAGVVFMHWLGTRNSTRAEFLDEAEALAQHGAVCLLVQGYFPWMSVPSRNADDRPQIIGQLIELRRAVDFLLDQPGVDAKRIGFVGHDYGAVYGGTLSGIDHRIKTFILIAGTPSFADMIGSSSTADNSGFQRDQYMQYVQDLDPIGYVPKAAPASLFFQFGERDSVVSKALADQYSEAASQPKKVEWYDDLHSLSGEAARQARQAWLVEQLKLTPQP